MTALRRPHRWLSALALAASLLLSLLPTAGRLRDALVPGGQAEAALAMCTTQGLAYRTADDLGAGWPGDWPAPQGGSTPAGQGDDCAYCPLLAALDLPASPVATGAPPASPATVPAPSRHGRESRRHRTGLGPRGPPLTRFAG